MRTALKSSSRFPVEFGSMRLPGIAERTPAGVLRHYMMVHPLWSIASEDRVHGPLAEAVAEVPGEIYFVDTFDASRRPVQALDAARDYHLLQRG